MKLDKIVLIRILGVVVVAIIILSVFFVSHRINNDNITYNKIVSYVSDNYEMLENFSYSEIEKIKSSNDKPEIRKQKEEEILKRHLGENTIVTRVYAYNENVLQFYCGSSGFLDAGTYTGFYFSRDDKPYAFEFNNLLPKAEKPEYTCGFEGFYHLTETTGSTEHTRLEYILRDHDAEKIEEKQATMKLIAEFINAKYGEGRCVLTMSEQYRNMKEKILPHFEVVTYAENAIRELGGEPVSEAVRGGTDGARLCYMGLPCPNLGTGGMNAHGRYECITEENMEKCVNVVIGIIKQFAK